MYDALFSSKGGNDFPGYPGGAPADPFSDVRPSWDRGLFGAVDTDLGSTGNPGGDPGGIGQNLQPGQTDNTAVANIQIPL